MTMNSIPINRRALTLLILIATFVLLLIALPGTASARPLFQMPVPEGETWMVSTWSGHNPALAADLNWGSTAEADNGKPTVASFGGRVTTSTYSTNSGYGNFIVIDHGDGWSTLYAHLRERNVSIGQTVRQGQRIGTVGNTSATASLASHLHYEQKLNGTPQYIYFNGSQIPYYAKQNMTSRNHYDDGGSAVPGVTGTPEYPGRYRLVARHSGKVADVQNGNTANGANVWQWYVNNGDAQHWEISHVANGYYRFRNVLSGRYLGATEGGTTDGTKIRQWDWTGNCGQLWRIDQAGSGFVRLVNQCSGKVLDVEGGPTATYDGADLQIWSVIGTNANQMWKLESLPQTYRVIARHSNKALDVAYGGTADGANVWQWSINDTNGGAAQRWDVKHEGEGYFSLRNRNSGKFLDVRYSGTANGTNVWQWGLTPGSCAQLWRIVSVGDGYNRLASKCSGRVLDVVVGSGAMNDGANVQIWDYLGFDNQKWRFTPAD